MEVRVLSSSVEAASHQFAATYIVNDVLSIDAGSLGLAELGRQKRVQSVVLSHAHLDHVATLPLFIDSVYVPGPSCPTIYASEQTIDVLKSHFFNDLVWPDVIRLSREESPFIKFSSLEDRKPVTLHGLVITPVALDHVVPTFGFTIDDGTSAVAFVSDTGPTEAIWQSIRENSRIRAVFLESAFPNSMAWLAEKAKHLTPALFQQEYAKAGGNPPVVAIHIKPAFYDAVVAELRQLNLSQLVISQPNQVYSY